MVKYIGFDMDCNKTVACVVESGKKDYFETLGPDIDSMQKFLKKQRSSGTELWLCFEISGQAGFIYDSLDGYADFHRFEKHEIIRRRWSLSRCFLSGWMPLIFLNILDADCAGAADFFKY